MKPRVRKESQFVVLCRKRNLFGFPVNERSPMGLRDSIVTVEVDGCRESDTMSPVYRLASLPFRVRKHRKILPIVPENFRPKQTEVPIAFEIRYGRTQQPMEPVLFKDFRIAILTHYISPATVLISKSHWGAVNQNQYGFWNSSDPYNPMSNATLHHKPGVSY